MNNATQSNRKNQSSPNSTAVNIPAKPLWPDNESVADYEREFYRESVESLIEAEEAKALSRKPLARLARSTRLFVSRIAALVSWRPRVSVPSVDLQSVLRQLETPVQRLASTYSERRRRENRA